MELNQTSLVTLDREFVGAAVAVTVSLGAKQDGSTRTVTALGSTSARAHKRTHTHTHTHRGNNRRWGGGEREKKIGVMRQCTGTAKQTQ